MLCGCSHSMAREDSIKLKWRKFTFGSAAQIPTFNMFFVGISCEFSDYVSDKCYLYIYREGYLMYD